MKTTLIENTADKQRVYDSLLLEAKHLGIFSNALATNIINELTKQPMCAMDVAKKLKQHEQKVYYHLRKMRNAGIVKLNGTEQRYGTTAKLFELVSPVIATKLYDDGYELRQPDHSSDPRLAEFFRPFIINGKLNCSIVIGDSYPHGKYDLPSTEGPHVFDFALVLGKLLKEVKFPHYSLDTDRISLKSHLILFGNPKTNIIIDKMNQHLPAYFDTEKDNAIVVKSSGNRYKDARVGVIIKMDNPFKKRKKLIVIGGTRTRGVQSAIIAVTQHLDKLIKDNDSNVVKIVEGYDSNGDKRIDSIKILE